jgi:hypothetical protein
VELVTKECFTAYCYWTGMCHFSMLCTRLEETARLCEIFPLSLLSARAFRKGNLLVRNLSFCNPRRVFHGYHVDSLQYKNV